MHMIPWIQYLRALAALMVVWHHSLGQVAGTEQFIPFSNLGGYGVQLFFMISGFIMLVTTWDKPIGPAEFIRLRLTRIVPLYWLATLGMILGAIVAPGLSKTFKWDGVSLVKSLFFIPYYSLSTPNEIRPLLMPGWSLNYEMFFYAIFALLLMVVNTLRIHLMVGAMLVLVAVGLMTHPQGAVPRVYTDPVLLEFAAGMIVGRIWLRMKHKRGDIGHPLLMTLGDASYSIYLTHSFTLAALRVLWAHFIPNPTLASSIGWMAVALVASALAGWICFRLIERPMTRGLKRWHPLSRSKAAHRSRAPSA
jgi:exopolysaccharide production protein ExoZ